MTNATHSVVEAAPAPAASTLSPSPGRRTRTARMRAGRRRREGRYALLFLAPWLAGLVLLTLGPMLASLYFSFTDFGLLGSPSWIGLDNYRELFGQDTSYHQSIKVTLLFVALSVPLKLIVALAVALLLNSKLRGMSFYRSAFYFPSLLGASVAVAIMWRQLFEGDGVVNGFLAVFGIEGPSWVSDPRFALFTIVALSTWQFGASMLIFLAGLQQIPRGLYEAARVDGASRLTQFWRITVPLLTPITFFNLVMQVIGSFQTFAQAYIISGGTGGPAESTLLYTLYLYRVAFTDFRMGYASAMAWILLATIGLVTLLNFLLSRYWVFYDDRE